MIESKESGINPHWENYKIKALEVMRQAEVLEKRYKPEIASNFLNILGNIGPAPRLQMAETVPSTIQNFTEEKARFYTEACDLLMEYFLLLEQHPDFAVAESMAHKAAYPEVISAGEQIARKRLKEQNPEPFSLQRYYIKEAVRILNPPQEKA